MNRGNAFIKYYKDPLAHSAKGTHWKHHKYIDIIDGVYKYAEGMYETAKNKVQSALDSDSNGKLDIVEKATSAVRSASNATTSATKDAVERVREAAAKAKENYQSTYDKDRNGFDDRIDRVYRTTRMVLDSDWDGKLDAAERLLRKLGIGGSSTSDENKSLDDYGFKKKQDQDASALADMALINPGYKTSYESTTNCMYCTTAFDLRRRGYDVSAAEKSSTDGPYDVLSLYTNPEDATFLIFSGSESTGVSVVNDLGGFDSKASYIEEQNYETSGHPSSGNIYKTLLSQGDGARGNIMVYFSSEYGGQAHSVAYEVSDGMVLVYDTQSGKKMSLARYTYRAKYIYTLRTDNLEYDPEKLDGIIVKN